MARLVGFIRTLILGLGCAGPSTTHTECAEMCRAEGKKVKIYETAPFAVRCECDDPN